MHTRCPLPVASGKDRHAGFGVLPVDLSQQCVKRAVVAVEPFDIIYVPKSPVGNFGYFAKNVLAGLGYGTRILYDVYNISHGSTTRY